MANVLLASNFIFLNWFSGFNELDSKVAHSMGNSWIDGQPLQTVLPVTLAILTTLLIVVLILRTRASWSKDEDRVVPEGRASVRNLLESVLDVSLNFGEMVLGSRALAVRFLPLIGGIGAYIWFSNLMGLIPFSGTSSSSLNVTIGPALLVFGVTHYVGVKERGLGHFEEFLGPKMGGFWWLAPLFIPLEIVSHIARPVSLSLRLMGNMLGDHLLLSVFLGFGVISILPIVVPFYFLGALVCTVQTLVFCLLSLVYIKLALADEE